MPVIEGASVTLANIVFPEQANHEGCLFGGEALALMDKAAFVAASRYSRRRVVTARSDGCDFRAPVRVGHLVEATAEVIATGRTSVSVEVQLIAENLLSGQRWLATRGRFVLVALDEAGRPAPLIPRGNDDGAGPGRTQRGGPAREMVCSAPHAAPGTHAENRVRDDHE